LSRKGPRRFYGKKGKALEEPLNQPAFQEEKGTPRNYFCQKKEAEVRFREEGQKKPKSAKDGELAIRCTRVLGSGGRNRQRGLRNRAYWGTKRRKVSKRLDGTGTQRQQTVLLRPLIFSLRGPRRLGGSGEWRLNLRKKQIGGRALNWPWVYDELKKLLDLVGNAGAHRGGEGGGPG